MKKETLMNPNYLGTNQLSKAWPRTWNLDYHASNSSSDKSRTLTQTSGPWVQHFDASTMLSPIVRHACWYEELNSTCLLLQSIAMSISEYVDGFRPLAQIVTVTGMIQWITNPSPYLPPIWWRVCLHHRPLLSPACDWSPWLHHHSMETGPRDPQFSSQRAPALWQGIEAIVQVCLPP